MNNAELIGQIRSLLDKLERGETSAEAAGDELKEVLPAWRPKPTREGVWMFPSLSRQMDRVVALGHQDVHHKAFNCPCYGPIPEPPK